MSIGIAYHCCTDVQVMQKKLAMAMHITRKLKHTASLTERNSMLARPKFWDHLGLFWGNKLLPVQNLTSYSCSATAISCKGDEISRL